MSGLPSINSQFQSLPDQLEVKNDFSIAGLSPTQKHRKCAERIKEVFEREGFILTQSNLSLRPYTAPFRDDQDEVSLAAWKYGIPIGGGVSCGVGSQVLSQAASSGVRSSRVKPNLFDVFVLSTAVIGIGTYFVTSSYRDFANHTRRDILEAYRQIGDDDINLQGLADHAAAVNARKSESYFNRIFEHCNPTSVGYLLLARGIAADSYGLYEEAQRHYQDSLEYSLQPNLRDCIRYVYARSLRLSNQAQQVIIQQLDLIQENSPFYRLSEIERQTLEIGIGEVFDGDTPSCFLCAINLVPMVNPVYYEVNDHRFYYERVAIEPWILEKGRCPSTGQTVGIQDLHEDNDLANAIVLWNQTKLKNHQKGE